MCVCVRACVCACVLPRVNVRVNTRARVLVCVCEEFCQMKKGCYRIQKIVERLLSFKIAICAIVVPACPCAFVRKRNNSTLVFFPQNAIYPLTANTPVNIPSRQTHRSISPHDKHTGQYPMCLLIKFKC